MPETWTADVPPGVVVATLTVSVLVVEPFGSGVTAAGTKLQVASAGRPAHARPTSELKPLAEAMVQVDVALLPCITASDDGLHVTLKSGSVETVGVTCTQLLTGLEQAGEAPCATTLYAYERPARPACR